MRDTVIQFDTVSYHYPRAKRWALTKISIDIHKGEFIAVMGENGAGKTTFCQCINGTVPNYHEGVMKGTVKTLGYDTQNCSFTDLADKIGMVLDDPEAQLFTTSVRNEVAFGAENLCIPKEEVLRRIDWALGIVELKEYVDQPPTALSGGQKQRLAIATNLAMTPSILVLDEPTSQLDPVGTRDVFEVIRELREKEDMTIVLATHKSEEIAEFADKVLVLKEGRVVAFDEPHVIFNDAELMRSCSIRPPQVSELAVYLRERGQEIGAKPILMQDAFDAVTGWYRGEANV